MLSWRLFYYDEVKIDIKEAKQWYNNKQKGLEKRFAKNIKSAIVRLQKNPLVYETRYKNVRIVYPDVFPYSIHFYLNEQSRKIVIIAILHQSRNPEYSQGRV